MLYNNLPLAEQTAIITGTPGGIVKSRPLSLGMAGNSIALDYVSTPTVLKKWNEEFQYLKEEVTFFHCLLIRGLPHCSLHSKPILKDLALEFATYKDEVLPELLALLNHSSEDAYMGSSLRRTFEKHNEAIKSLKAKAFPLLGELFPLTIR